MSKITEKKAVQRPLIKYAQKVGWKYIDPSTALRYRGGQQEKFFRDILAEKILDLNSEFIKTQSDAQKVIRNMEAIPDSLEGNKQLLDYLKGRKTFFDDGEKRNRNIQLIDFQNIENNKFFVTEEWTQKGNSGDSNRSDVMFLVNGIPLAVVENKNPKKVDAVEEAIQQLMRYERETPEMMSCPQVFNVTQSIEYFYGATWNYSRKNIFNWKKELRGERDKQITLEEAVTSFFNRYHFLKLIKDWVLFYYQENELSKTVLMQHQTRAIEKIYNRCQEQSKKRGLIWHTQGSGKTFTMITAARTILEKHPQSTVMMIIDRNELEGQLSDWINALVSGSEGNNQTIAIRRANTKCELQAILSSDTRGLIISMLHKFDGIKKDSCTREDFYVLIDEAHRSVNKDLGSYLMAAFPNSTIFGFTGTPVDKTASGKGTFKVFGREDKEGYLDKYSIQESIGDGTTLKLNHTIVPNELMLSGELLEEEFLQLTDTEGISDIETLNNILRKAVKLRAFLKASDRVERVSEYIAKHFKENVQPLGYKAFVVAVDREACVLYKKALDKRMPKEWSKVIYSSGQNDPEELSQYTLSKEQEMRARKSFKKPGQDPQILIVTDKLITGFDAPILYCMYLDKPMRDHTLLQAIARVNRPYQDKDSIQKPCGLVIDFIGVFKDMKKALSFDPDEVNAVIEDLDKLFEKFKHSIEREFKELISSDKRDDKFVENIVYEVFSDPDKRKDFLRKARELEVAYEILSPDARLTEHLQQYREVIGISQLVREAYREKDPLSNSLSKKTELLIKEHVSPTKLHTGKTFRINEKSLAEIKEDKGSSDNVKIMNLLKSLSWQIENKKDENPSLISIREKADGILEKYKQDQSDSKNVLEELLKISEELVESNEKCKSLGLSTEVFSIYWTLSQDFGLREPVELAEEINILFENFKHFSQNAEEERKLKIQLYKLLGSLLDLEKRSELIEALLKTRRRLNEN